MKNKKVVFVLGATAVGKSEVGVKIAQRFSGEIISADSVQIFRGLNIGSAKITKEQMQNVPHHGIDIVEPEQKFTAFDYAQFTKQKIDEICLRNHLPVVVGGTGLYVKALTSGYNFGGAEDEVLRQQLEDLADEKGVDFLWNQLYALDKDLANSTDKFNRVRVIRALAIAKSGGQKLQEEVDFQPLLLNLTLPRQEMYQKINARVDKMLESGLLDEVRALKSKGLSAQNQSMHAIGYKEALLYLDGEISYEKMVELTKQHSRNYAKRQLTFLRKMDTEDFDMTEDGATEKICQRVQKFLDE